MKNTNPSYKHLQTVIEILKNIEKDCLKIKNPSDKVTLLIESSQLAIQLGKFLKGIYDYEKDPENVGMVLVVDDYLDETEFFIDAYGQEGIDESVEEMSGYDLGQNTFNLVLFAGLLDSELKGLWHYFWNIYVDNELIKLVETLSHDLVIKDLGKRYKFNK